MVLEVDMNIKYFEKFFIKFDKFEFPKIINYEIYYNKKVKFYVGRITTDTKIEDLKFNEIYVRDLIMLPLNQQYDIFNSVIYCLSNNVNSVGGIFSDVDYYPKYFFTGYNDIEFMYKDDIKFRKTVDKFSDVYDVLEKLSTYYLIEKNYFCRTEKNCFYGVYVLW
jgi:hypothetical protein